MSSVAAFKTLLLRSLREVGSKKYLIEYVRYRTCKAAHDKGFSSNCPDGFFIKDMFERLSAEIQYIRNEMVNVVDTYSEKTARRYFRGLKDELTQPLTITQASAFAVISEHNQKALQAYAKKVDWEEKIYFEHPERRYKHLEMFIRVTPSWFSPWTSTLVPEKKEEIINKNFYEVNIDSDLLDDSYIGDYLYILATIKDALVEGLWEEIDWSQRELLQAANTAGQETGETAKPIKPHKDLANEVSFEDFLTDEGQAILPFLKGVYIGQKKKMWAYMLYALSDLGIIRRAILNSGHSQLYRAMEHTFGDKKIIGTRQNLINSLKALESASSDQEAVLKSQKTIIKDALQGGANKAKNLQKTCSK